MGYSLPAAIGAAFVSRPRPVTCITGDGGLMICLGELATLVKHRLPVRVILFNNHCHGIQKQTLETWLDGNYVGVDPDSGLAFPEFSKVSEAMGLKTVTIRRDIDIEGVLQNAYAYDGPIFINVEINPNQKLYPVLKFGAPLESQIPEINQKLLESEMVIPPFKPLSQPNADTGGAGV